MATLQSRPLAELNLDTRKITINKDIEYYDADTNIANIFLQIYQADNNGVITYLDSEELSNYTAKLFLIKPITHDFKEITGVATTEITTENGGGVLKFVLPKSCTNRYGVVKCEMHIIKNDELLASDRFVYSIYQSLVTEFNDSLLEDSDFPVLQQLIKNVQKVDTIDDTTASATTTYSSNKIENIKSDISSQIKDIENELGTETLNTTSQNLKSAINEVFQSVSNGKALVASAITDKGVSTSSSDSFSTMATNIRSIPNQGGGITPSGTINITANGTVDVTNYATASINVEGTGDTTIVTTTNTNTLNKRGSKKLSFGVISDIHITTDTTNSANVKFANALDFFEAQSCNFVVMNGDIANYDKANELNTYGTMIADYTLPIYEIMGNHDAGTGTSTTEDEWTTLTGNTFKFEIINNDEVFLFLSQRKWSDYSTAENNRMLTQEDKNWLSGKLESYKNKPRVFLFHHQYLDNCEGFAYRNGTESNSNIVNDVDYWTNIVSTYKNVTWFSGHSHSPFSLQDTYPNNTVYNKNGEYCNMIHVPSLTSGQYYIVTVYDGLFEIQGYEDGTKVDSAYYIIGNYSSSSSSSTEDKTTYTITNNLTNVTNSNLYLSIEEGNAYTATLTATDGYNITSVTVTMGGTDITSTVYSAGNINISSVTGDIVITASAEEIAGTYYTITNNLNNATTSNSATSVEENSSYSATITANNNYELSSITVTMGGIDISSTAVSGANISISSVTGNIIITVTTTAIYTITNTLSNASTNNSSTTAKSGTSYTATITANDGYVIDTVTVTMGGTDITSNSYSNGAITINSVTGNIVITVTTAVQLTKTVAYSKASQTFNFTSSLKSIQIETGTLATANTFTELPIPLEAGKIYYMRCESLKYSDGTDVSIENDKIYVTGIPYSGDTKVTNKIVKDYSNIVGVDVLLTQDTGTLITSYGSNITKIAQLALRISSRSPKISSLPFTVTMTNFEIFTYGESI